MSFSQRVLVVLVALGVLVACRHPFQPTQAEVCTYEKAVRVGESHATTGIRQFENVSHVCPIDVRTAVDQGYDEGYQHGLALRLEKAQAQYCGYDAGYKQGVNDAQRGLAMQGQVPDICTADSIADTAQGYREGYTFMIENQPTQVNVLYGTDNVTEIKGFVPQEECIEAYGDRVCGYGCIEAYGDIRCASNPQHKCMESYGEIYCGLNCTESYGEVTCDIEE